MKVIVENLVDSKSYFTGEMKENFMVIYEKLQQSDAIFSENGFEEIEGDTAEYVKIMKDPGEECCLKSIKSYKIGREFKCVDDVLASIKEAHRDIFK
ncbi:hypothetical protein JOC78_001229 [Bacillus ectoiniformans]|uniref:hypothetical protein n=1 Tax=Bacillus ectoiniformans TaxID=1494429 RepID=UPI00195C942C|nr:hypothetical protein [Bacillus ectoiniformans]MBM7648287.1 hypothetical protein [Bacillus ectoiniformans]